MDGTGNFAGHSADEGVETPINIGNDERRMHVRAYNYWVSLLDGRAYPSIEDLNPENIEDFGPNSVLLDFTGGLENPAISWLGHKLRNACELPEGVASVADIPSRSLLSRLTDHYMQIIANRAPIGFEAEFTSESGVEIMYRGILMPFSSDDDTIDFIYGVINWKEAADKALVASIENEVEQALDAVPAPRQDPAVPAWADGPAISRDADEDVSFELDEEPLSLEGFATVDDEQEDFQPAPRFVADGDECLADWLAAARSSAEAAGQADLRSRSALYRALAEAYDFALTADERPDEYQDILNDANLIAQPRAPMTPIVKLVFGVGYDKTRLAEYAAVLTHARSAVVDRGGLQDFIEAYSGGIKGIISAERAARRPASAPKAKSVRAVEKARGLQPRGIVEIEGAEEFVILVARRIDDGHVAVLGRVDADDRVMDKALRQLIK